MSRYILLSFFLLCQTGDLLSHHLNQHRMTVASTGELLMIVQHEDTGKTDQILMRFFDINPGTDIRFELDGKPINMISHATGKGAKDPYFLNPELFFSSM